jgi:hypothetical protein
MYSEAALDGMAFPLIFELQAVYFCEEMNGNLSLQVMLWAVLP